MKLRFHLGRRATGERALEGARRGSRRHLEQLYEANVDTVYAFVFYRVGRDASLAEDVVQETFARALSSLETYDTGRGSVSAWLCTLSRNIARDHLRAHRRSSELANTWQRIDESLAQVFAALDRDLLTDEVMDRAETQELVNMTIANLPENYRDVLELKYVNGWTLAGLAEQLSVSEEAAKSLLARARRAFRDAFKSMSKEMAEVS